MKKSLTVFLILLIIIGTLYYTGYLQKLTSKYTNQGETQNEKEQGENNQPTQTNTGTQEQQGEETSTKTTSSEVNTGATNQQGEGETTSNKETFQGWWNGTIIGKKESELAGGALVDLLIGELNGKPVGLLTIHDMNDETPILLDEVTIKDSETITLAARGYEEVVLNLTFNGTRLTGTLFMNLTSLYNDSGIGLLYYNVNLSKVKNGNVSKFFAFNPYKMVELSQKYPLTGSVSGIVENLSRIIGDYVGGWDKFTTQYLTKVTKDNYTRAAGGFNASGLDFELYNGSNSIAFFLNLYNLFIKYNYTMIVPPDPITYTMIYKDGGTLMISACNPTTQHNLILLFEAYKGYSIMEIAASDNPTVCNMIKDTLAKLRNPGS